MNIPDKVEEGAQSEIHYNLMCGVALAVKVSFFSQKCLQVGSLREAHNIWPHTGQFWKSPLEHTHQRPCSSEPPKAYDVTPPIPIA